MYCKSCGSETEEEDTTCPTCETQIIVHKRDPKTAAMVSIVPGIGQIYNGELLKGTSFILLDIIFIIIIIILIGFSIVFPTFWTFTLVAVLVGIIFWVYNIYDAYNNTKKEKKES